MLVPVTRRLDDRNARTRLVQGAGRRSRTVGWIALAVLIATGLLNLWIHPALLSSPRLHWTLGLVGLTLILSAFHDFVLGPRAGAPGADPSARVRASWIARINVLVVLVIACRAPWQDTQFTLATFSPCSATFWLAAIG